MSKPVLIIGAGGHAKVLIEMLLQEKRQIIGVVAPEIPAESPVFNGIPRYWSDADVTTFDCKEIELANGIGSLPGKFLRFDIYKKFRALGYSFTSVISPWAFVSKYVAINEGVQIFPGAIINTDAVIGENTIINTRSVVEHDCVIGAHNHLAPGVTFSGGVKTGDYVHVGTGACVIHAIHIGDRVVIGAGATVTKRLPSDSKIYVAKPFIDEGNII